MVRVAQLEQIDRLFTNAPPPKPFPELLAHAQVRCEVAEEPESVRTL
jgi:DeoR family glycerol-3-phosphate regulon repressor